MKNLILIKFKDNELIVRTDHIKAIWVEDWQGDSILNIKHGKITKVFAGTKKEMAELFYSIKQQLKL